MRRVSYYRAALVLPILIPLFVWLFMHRLGENDADAMIALFFLYSLPIAGLPYLGFAGVFAWWMRNKPAASIRRATRWAPVLFIPWLWLVLLVQGMIRGTVGALMPDGNLAKLFLLLLLGVLVVGYAYVGMVEAGRWLGERLGIFSEPDTP